ncbi:alpha-amylase [Vibrio albus]|uniref:Alpha-amylase n=1 Tax=Vibrio albus TaxID=2200953 RepID=A0A2U3BBA6_9VIBR|nr:alpha-amylase [Vibrio albus]PWI34082.1 alpha-amylase [Vibrio albus]
MKVIQLKRAILPLSLLLSAPVYAYQNGTMMQYFHWYVPNDGTLWTQVETNAPLLSDDGFTALWLPPAYKGTGGGYDVGYGVYDMYDLGEFDQKGSVRTKYGTKDEYISAIQAAHQNNIQIYGDVVFNHRGGADGKSWVDTTKVDWDNRNIELGDKWIEAWVEFNFPARNDTYSSFHWTWYHFDGVDWDDAGQEKAIFKFKGTGKAWDWEVSSEKGNYDYLMYADLDMDHPEVKQELKDWGEWYLNMTGVDGFRMDAVKHIKYQYLQEWIDYLRNKTGKELFTVGEYWNYDVSQLQNFITKTSGSMSLFDAPLHMNFYNASHSGGNYDMRQIMDGTLMKDNPVKAVTLVENHDTQPLQALESTVDWWFKPLAYAFILLREEGYPSVFYADYYGAQYSDNGYDINMVQVPHIQELVSLRKNYAYGTQHSYLDHWDIIGWTREGDTEHPNSMAVIMTDAAGGSKWMYTGHANTSYVDQLGNRSEVVWTDGNGWAEFPVNGGSVSVWVSEN